ncbi:uncharacterized protein B0H18DRAFT_651144 [Fomitopsis serialis]|uniref:uncharacterized protein n=1 Tax=Fomitopsis serialis TaxID=139415 RepID=UPI002008D2D4|nr:uncharacterized protein B0H18DRAFT_651144 [Neoantrodia serialis]KAH9919239.1 hypothetical protein B0H18DRAFT_651144 [Neoantrodia serialis]
MSNFSPSATYEPKSRRSRVPRSDDEEQAASRPFALETLFQAGLPLFLDPPADRIPLSPLLNQILGECDSPDGRACNTASATPHGSISMVAHPSFASLVECNAAEANSSAARLDLWRFADANLPPRVGPPILNKQRRLPLLPPLAPPHLLSLYGAHPYPAESLLRQPPTCHLPPSISFTALFLAGRLGLCSLRVRHAFVRAVLTHCACASSSSSLAHHRPELAAILSC